MPGAKGETGEEMSRGEGGEKGVWRRGEEKPPQAGFSLVKVIQDQAQNIELENSFPTIQSQQLRQTTWPQP